MSKLSIQVTVSSLCHTNMPAAQCNDSLLLLVACQISNFFVMLMFTGFRKSSGPCAGPYATLSTVSRRVKSQNSLRF